MTDVIEISKEEYEALIEGHVNGKQISCEDGKPVLIDPPAITLEQWLNAVVRPERDRRMDAFEWRIERFNREVRLGITSADDIDTLDNYMQTLADFPETFTEVVDDIPWPAEP